MGGCFRGCTVIFLSMMLTVLVLGVILYFKGDEITKFVREKGPKGIEKTIDGVERCILWLLRDESKEKKVKEFFDKMRKKLKSAGSREEIICKAQILFALPPHLVYTFSLRCQGKCWF